LENPPLSAIDCFADLISHPVSAILTLCFREFPAKFDEAKFTCCSSLLDPSVTGGFA
jgi:hypothetical protein